MTQVAILEKVMMYIPVADETFGGTPIESKRGLKMTPPPRPRAPATHPPKNPKQRTFLRILPSKTRSLSAKLTLLYFFLSYYSELVILTATYTIASITMKKTPKKTQSPALHFSILKSPFPPLSRDWMSKHERQRKLMPCFFHWPWLSSCLIIFFKIKISLSFCSSPVGSFGKPSVSRLESD